jgi:hypothetical protein
MGLAEKRAVEEIKQKMTSEWEKAILSSAGLSIPIEVKYDTFMVDGTAGYAVQSFEKIFVTPTINAFKTIAADDLGKQALAGALKKIVIKNEAGLTSSTAYCTMDSGTLTLDHRFANVDQIADRQKGLTALLERSL